MMNVNQATIIGNVTRDPQMKTFGEGNHLTTFAVATNAKKKEGKQVTEYHTIVTFGKLAEICNDYVKKGRLVYVQGKIHTGKWQDENNVVRSKTDIIANEMLLLDKKQALVSASQDEEEVVTEAIMQEVEQLA